MKEVGSVTRNTIVWEGVEERVERVEEYLERNYNSQRKWNNTGRV